MEEGSPPDGTSSEAWQIFLQLRDLPPAVREYRLVEVCGEDAALQREVVHLLIEEEDKTWLFQPGDLLDGRYEIIRPIGRGGLSEVYLAIQLDDDERRTTAVKILRGGDYDGLVRAEREGLRLRDLQHPNIPTYRDHGTLPTGQPFLAMEYIHGLPIDLYCQRNELSIRDRLELFLHVCSAVSFLHQKRLLHRDLKPSNILVTSADVPKVLDFNIAKRLPQEGAADQTLTAGRVMPPFTANYASPEQIIGRYLDQSSDVYSLGVVLYELLTGAVPADLGRLLDQPEELRRAALKEQISPPSAVATESVDRDLELIVAKALRKIPEERYRSAGGLAEDIANFLDRRPISAQPPTFLYRAGKFASRHRAALGFSAILLAGILASAALLFVQYQNTARQRDRAERVTRFLVDVFAAAAPTQSQGEEVRISDIIREAERELQSELTEEPLDRAYLIDTLGLLYLELGEVDKGIELAREALRLRNQHLGSRREEAGSSHLSLGWLLLFSGAYEESEAHLSRAVEIFEHSGSREKLAEAHLKLSTLLERRDKSERALRHAERARDLYLTTSGPESEGYSAAMSRIATVYQNQGNYEAAEELFRRVYNISKKLNGENHSSTAVTLSNLGLLLHKKAEYQEAEALLTKAHQISKRVHGPDHPRILSSLNNLTMVYAALGKLDLAISRAEEAKNGIKKSYGTEHPFYAKSLQTLGTFYRAAGQQAQAKNNFEEATLIKRAVLGDRHPSVAISLNSLAGLLADTVGFEKAEPLYLEAISIYEDSYGKNHPEHATFVHNLSVVARKNGYYARAEALSDQALQQLEAAIGQENVYYGYLLRNAALIAEAQEDYRQAEMLFLQSLEKLEKYLGLDHEETKELRDRFQEFYIETGQPEKAAGL